MKTMLKDKRVQYVLIGLLCIISLYSIPFKRSTLTIMSTVAIYSIAAIGFNVLLGFAGQISLGHAAFIGLGAYVSAYLTYDLGLPFLVALLMSAIVPIALGIILGLVALRLEGHFLAIATLGFGVAVQQVFKVVTKFTNGFAGKTAPLASIFGYTIKSGEAYFTMSVVILVVLAIITHNLINSKTGRAFIAMRDSEHAAQAMGINLVKYKLIAFSVSAMFAGISGSLYMHLVKYTQPDVWGVVLSINLLAMVVIGGMASVGGSILGAAFITLLPQLAHEIPVIKNITNSAIILTGLAIVLVIRLLPGGLMVLGSEVHGLWRRQRTDRRMKHEHIEG
ncbi:MAG: branched-chain amino acid ABC transporter permease [Bacillota bacterium]